MGAIASRRKQKRTHYEEPEIVPTNIKLVYSDENPNLLQEKKSGGLFYYIHMNSPREPNANPNLLRNYQKMKRSSEIMKEMSEGLEEKMLIADILRAQNLHAKGKPARDFREKQAKVLERKTQLRQDMKQRIKEKMFMNEIRLLNRPRMQRASRYDHKPQQSKSADTGTLEKKRCLT